MAGVSITTRIIKSGPRFIVRYRLGGRSAPLIYAGSFRRLDAAEKLKGHIEDAIASGRLADVARIREHSGLRHRDERIYFARLGDVVKIGVSVEPKSRCRTLNAELLLTLPGGREAERALHDQFAEHRVRGEWFRAEPLVAYVAEQDRLSGRAYLERGDPVTVLIRWNGRGPRNVLIRQADGSRVVRPFRGLRRVREALA